jgi:SAM-dependent methyltransferase
VRLGDQAGSVLDLLHGDTSYPPGSVVLEAGCGVGAQTVTLARNSPGATFVAMDISADSLDAARAAAADAGLDNVRFRLGDVYSPDFDAETFDHVFACFVLEHLPRPMEALASLGKVLKSDGTITVFEGDHGSTCFHPENADARRTIQCLINLQARAGGDSLIGRRLYPLLVDAGFADVTVSPRMVYVDVSRPHLVDGFTRNTFTAMVEGVRDRALAAGLIDADTWDKGIRALYRTAEADGTFCYTFFKAMGVKR